MKNIYKLYRKRHIKYHNDINIEVFNRKETKLYHETYRVVKRLLLVVSHFLDFVLIEKAYILF